MLQRFNLLPFPRPFFPLDSQELSTLGEPHGIESILEIRINREVCTHLSDLVVDIHEKAIERVLNKIISNLDGMNIDPRDLLLHHFLNTTQAEGITTAVPCKGVEG